MNQIKYLLILLGPFCAIQGERWYTATVIENNNITTEDIREGRGNNLDATLTAEHQNQFPDKQWHYLKSSDIAKQRPILQRHGAKPIKFQPSSPIKNIVYGVSNGKFWYNKTINNVKKDRPRRKLVKRCPSISDNVQSESNQKGRFLEVFQVVEFQHTSCSSSSGLEGACLPRYDCEASGGISMGDCADGYGTCCVTQISCGDQSSAHTGWFTNPGFPSPSSERLSCAVTLEKASPDIKQIRLDFLNFELLPPNLGTCEEDQFVVSGHNINSFAPILCGVNNGQHVYVEVGDVEGPVYLSIQTVTADTRVFAIKITQLTSTDELAAPSGCTQYYTESQGYLESFNYQDRSTLALAKIPSYLNNLNYAMCIKRAPESCTITYTNAGDMSISNYDAEGLPLIPPGQAGVEIFNCPSDWLMMAGARLCGDRFNDGSVLQDFSLNAPVTDSGAGPIVVWFRTDGFYVGRGFRLQYQQHPCSSPS